MLAKVYYKVREFQPAAVGTDETTPLLNIDKGERVISVSIMPLAAAAASTTSTITVGDDADPDGFVTTGDYDPETATLGTGRQGSGALLANAGGKLYGAANTIDAVYTANGATGARPRIAVKALVVREWPT